MKNFNNFDESVKNKLDGMNFQFNDANWEKMSQMIDASRPAKKPFGKLPLISSIVIGSALMIGSAWYFISETTDTKEVAQNTNTSVTVITNNNASLITENTSVTSNNTNNNSNQNNSSENNILSNSNNFNSSSDGAERNNLSGKNEKSSLNMNSEKKKGVTKTSGSNSVKLNNSIAKESEVQNNYSSETDPKTSNKQDLIGKEEGARLKTESNTDSKSIVTKSNAGGTIKAELGKTAEQQTNEQASNEDRNILASDQEESDLIALPSVTTNLGQTAETMAAANLKTATLEEKKAWEYVRVKHHTLTLEGGASNSFGWAVNETRNGNTISPVLGINYMYNIDSRSSLLIGLQYNSIANLGEAKANFSVTTYGFGVNNDVTTYKLNDLHYAVMPLKYIYRMNKNNALGFGANMMYLMNTRTEIINTKTLESNVTNSQSHYEFGYGFNQLNKFNAQVAVSYHHNISNKLAMNVEVNKTLMNVVKDYKYFGAKNTNNAPAAIKLSLTYTLFNK